MYSPNSRLARAVRRALLGFAALSSPAPAAEDAQEKQRRPVRGEILKRGAATLGAALDHLPGIRADTSRLFPGHHRATAGPTTQRGLGYAF